VIVALAGRRIDALDAPAPRFPAANVALVGERLRALFRSADVHALVVSAACGADLTALAVADELGIRRHIVLPFAAERFRTTSVVDRPGGWGPLFDRLVAAAQAAGELEIVGADEGDAAYARANEAILDRATALGAAAGEPVEAVVVWDGPLTGRPDHTQEFATSASRRGLPVRAVASA
jgi:hypothetical protein